MTLSCCSVKHRFVWGITCALSSSAPSRSFSSSRRRSSYSPRIRLCSFASSVLQCTGCLFRVQILVGCQRSHILRRWLLPAPLVSELEACSLHDRVS